MIPLYQRPATVVFVDDEPTYVEMLGLVLPASWQSELFTRAQECLDYMRADVERLERDVTAQSRIVQRWQQGDGTLPQLLLDYWARDAVRYDTTRVLVVDYSMPSMTGLDLLDQLGEWAGTRILLTGRADEHTAVAAFNRSQIDQYLPKQTPEITQRVQELVGRALARAHPGLDPIWRGTLSASQITALRRPAVMQGLSRWLEREWVEYCVIGQPFGILGVDARGQAGWLQLELRENLGEHAELLEAALGVEARDAAPGIRSGARLAHVEFQQSLRCAVTAQLEPAFPIGDGSVLAARFPVQVQVPAYADWRAARGDAARVH